MVFWHWNYFYDSNAINKQAFKEWIFVFLDFITSKKGHVHMWIHHIYCALQIFMIVYYINMFQKVVSIEFFGVTDCIKWLTQNLFLPKDVFLRKESK